MVTDKVFLEGIEEGEGAKVEAVTENRHIVGIHHPVGKAHRLPVGYHTRGITYHQSKPGLVALIVQAELGIMLAQGEIEQLLELVGLTLLAVTEILEVAKTYMATGQAHGNGAFFQRLAPHRQLRADHRQRLVVGTPK